MVRSLMASRMAMSEPCRKHIGLAHSLEAIMISFSVKFNPTSPSPEPLLRFWPHHFQFGPWLQGHSLTAHLSLTS